jgi:hypothetical protein
MEKEKENEINLLVPRFLRGKEKYPELVLINQNSNVARSKVLWE